MLKYLLGILIVQAATVAMTLAAIKSGDQELWLAVLLLGLLIALVTAFWFASIASHAKKMHWQTPKMNFPKSGKSCGLTLNAKRPDYSAKAMKKFVKRPIAHTPGPASNWVRVLLVLLPLAH
jgi:hypothetical protein